MSDAIITSPANPTVKLIRSLAEKKHRQETGLFVAEGPKVLVRARSEGWEPDYLVSTSTPDTWGKAKPLVVDGRIMALLSAQKNASPLLGVFRQCWAADVKPSGPWLALEDMRDPGNLGSIIRTADAAGVSGIILAGQSCDPWGPDCVRATMGSIFAMPLVKLELAAFLDLAKAWPGETIGTHLTATQSYRRDYKQPTLLVMGSEGKGLTEQAAKACSSLVRIPMKEGAESLNVAIATALVLYEALKP